MSTTGHKRKRCIEDIPLRLSKTKVAMRHLISLKEELHDFQDELNGVQETEGEMDAIMQHVVALQKILMNAKEPVRKYARAIILLSNLELKLRCSASIFHQLLTHTSMSWVWSKGG